MAMNETRLVAVDIETTGLSYNDELLSVAAAWRGPDGVQSVAWSTRGDLFHAPVHAPYMRHLLHEVIRPGDTVVTHNGAFDLPMLFKSQILLPGEVKRRVYDTMLGARMTGAHDSVSLFNLCEEERLVDVVWAAQKKRRSKLEQEGVENLLSYNRTDAEKTLLLAELQRQRAVAIYGEDFIVHEHDYVRLMAEVRHRGKRLNVGAVKRRGHDMSQTLYGIVKDRLVANGISGPSDRKGILNYCRDHDIKIEKRTIGGDVAVDEEALQGASGQDPDGVLEAVLEARTLEKAISTWVYGMADYKDEFDLVHPNYTVAGAVSYRLTCSHPNLQAVPGDYSSLWAEHISADYSQAELRVAAAFAQEKSMARAFAEGADVHAETARLMFGSVDKEKRRIAKSCNFASIYGGGVTAVVRATGIDEGKVKSLLASHRRAYKSLYEVSKKAETAWQDRGYLRLLLGKRLYATKDDLENRPYKAFNQLVQGSVAELVQEAMMRIDAAGMTIVGQVHDSIELAPDADVEQVKEIMAGVFPPEFGGRTDPAIVMAADVDLKGSAIEQEAQGE